MAALYFPWFLVLLAQIRHISKGYWIPKITGRTIWGYVEWAFGTAIPHSAVMMLIVWLLVGVRHFCLLGREKNEWDVFAAGGYLVPLLTVVSGVVASWLMQPIYYDRYVFPALGILCMFFAISIRNVRKRTLAAGFVFILLTGVAAYRDTYWEEYKSTYVPETEAFFEENLKEQDVIIYNWKVYGFLYEYYFDDKLIYVGDFDFDGEYGDIWFLNTAVEQQIPAETLSEHGLAMEYVKHLGIEQNEFDLYRIYPVSAGGGR